MIARSTNGTGRFLGRFLLVTLFCGTAEPLFGQTTIYVDANSTDIGMMVERFKSVIPPTKVQAMLRGNVIPAKSAINVTDIGRVVDGFKSIAYRQVGPSACIEDCE